MHKNALLKLKDDLRNHYKTELNMLQLKLLSLRTATFHGVMEKSIKYYLQLLIETPKTVNEEDQI